MRSFGSIEQLINAPATQLRQAGLAEDIVRAFHHPDLPQLQQDEEWLAQEGHALIPFDDERYPALLTEIPIAPAALFVAGDIDALWQPQVAVIGSRNPTAGGVENARDFAGTLARQGFTITSGLAMGIDATAHRAALDAGAQTVAVLGSGLDRIYPAINRSLAQDIRRQGVLVSEFPPGTAAKREHFPSRNRIISGLSLGVLVVEAALNSGSLITARLAAEQGREVFALPGSIHNPLAKGCHRLIREGARLVETDAEILQELAPLAGQLARSLQQQIQQQPAEKPTKSMAQPNPEDDADYSRLWSCLGHDPLPVDILIASSGLTAKAVSAMLLMLELGGRVEAHPGGAFSRKTRGL